MTARWTACLVGALLAVAVFGCDNPLGPTDGERAFDRDMWALCGDGTSSLSVHTAGGGHMRIDVVDACGAVRPCVGSDDYAPDSWATIRASGSDISIDGCEPVPARGGTSLRVTFESAMGETERHELPISGSCLDAGRAGCLRPDAGTLDAGVGGDGGRDAGARIDATIGADAS